MKGQLQRGTKTQRPGHTGSPEELEFSPGLVRALSDGKSLTSRLTGMRPASPVLQDGVKGRTIKRNYLTGKPRPLGRVASKSGDWATTAYLKLRRMYQNRLGMSRRKTEEKQKKKTVSFKN